MDAETNGNTKFLEEVKELVRSALSSATTAIFKDKLTENVDVPATTTTTTTTEEASQKIPAVENFYNDSNPTKAFESFKELIRCKDFSEVDSKALDSYVHLKIKRRKKGTTDVKACHKSLI